MSPHPQSRGGRRDPRHAQGEAGVPLEVLICKGLLGAGKCPESRPDMRARILAFRLSGV